MTRRHILVGGFVYMVVPGDEHKLDPKGVDNELFNGWVEVEPTMDPLSSAIPGQRIQISQIIAYVDRDDEPAEPAEPVEPAEPAEL